MARVASVARDQLAHDEQKFLRLPSRVKTRDGSFFVLICTDRPLAPALQSARSGPRRCPRTKPSLTCVHLGDRWKRGESPVASRRSRRRQAWFTTPLAGCRIQAVPGCFPRKNPGLFLLPGLVSGSSLR